MARTRNEQYSERDAKFYDRINTKAKKPIKELVTFCAKKAAREAGKSEADISINEFVITAVIERMKKVGITQGEIEGLGITLEQVKMIHETIDVLGILGLEE